MQLKKRLIKFRTQVRNNSKFIIDTILADHNANICVFCGGTENLTKEHVIPKWVYSNNPNSYFTTTTNDQDQTYNKTTIPACHECNSYILGYLEKVLVSKFDSININDDFFDDETLDLIILWLEIVEYKFHVLNMRRTFRKIKDKEFIPYLADFPISILLNNASLSPSKVFSNLRQALATVAKKSKFNRRNSLVVFSTVNPDHHFFHKTNEFIFVEIPKLDVAFFYFFKENFKSTKDSFKRATEIIEHAY